MLIEKKNISIKYSGKIPPIPFQKIKNEILGTDYDLSVVFLGPKKAKKLNIEYRSKDYIPNTLSFPLSKSNGEIIICKSIAQIEFKKFNLSFENYLLFLFIHSCLHLKGFEHGGTMEKAESSLLNRFLF